MPNLRRLLAAALGFFTIYTTAMAQRSESFDLRDYLWERRVLIVFSSDSDQQPYRDLMQAIETQRAAFDDRDMLLIVVPAKGEGRVGEERLSRKAGDRLRERFRFVDRPFGVVLIGKDGGTKLREEGPTSLDAVFALIDTMPMRREEMRTRHHK